MKKCLLILLVVIFALSGCSTPPQTNEDIPPETTLSENNDSNDSVLVKIENAEGTIDLTVEENSCYEGSKASIAGNNVNHTGNQIIQGSQNVADWGAGADGAHFFEGSYIVNGPELKTARFCFSPTMPQNFDPLSCGINFYDVILTVKGVSYNTAAIVYAKELTAQQVKEQVSFEIFPISADMKTKLGCTKLTLTCSVDQSANISLLWADDCFRLESTVDIQECIARFEYKEYSTLAYANQPAQIYNITTHEGIQVPSV